ncbi:hypothetical protein F5050DRAFT_1904426 [Lentinula boryana]|uniref:Mitochondrial carrier n=1 Tax=Lentinula boryana TaxID=40481 RepID=A0ABQ8Q613_9AGAR|nr:hypothetical protein F5050DRAFT_1904426 [Lentinula boryana]
MEFWPEDNQIHGSSKSRRRGKGKGKAALSGTSYLEHGRLEAVTLIENKSHFKWTSPFSVFGGLKLTPGNSVEVFRPTRPPAVHIPPTSIAHRAEQGANFLRMYFPETDIGAELIRQELATDAQVVRDLKQYDPFSRNVLELLNIPDAPPTRQFIAFPTGITGSDLNICSFNSLGNNSLSESSIDLVKSFSTPILQLISTQVPTSSNAFLAARTFGSTILLRARYTPVVPYITFTEQSTITREDTGQRSSVDVKFHSRQPKVLFVNDEGCLYKRGIEDGQNTVAFRGIENPDSGDKFWKIAIAGDSEDGCLLSSSKVVHELDFRTDASALNLFDATSTNEKFTGIEDSGDNFLVSLASTERILWLDRRFPGRPLLGIKHRRNYDRTLAVHTVTIRGSHHLLMTSRKNRLITIYDVSRSNEQLLHIDNAPYSFSIDTRESRFAGDAYMNVENQHKLFRISERGRLTCVDLMQSNSDSNPTTSVASSQYSPCDSPEMLPDLGPLGAREFSQTNLRPAYEQLFPSVVDIDNQEEKNAEALYDLLDHLPSFWQRDDLPIEQILTTLRYDILFRAGEEPSNPSRADILTETVFNSARGYRTLLQGRLPIQTLIEGAAWSSNIAPIMKHFDESTTGDIGSIAEHLRSFDLEPHPDNLVQASRRQDKARELLTLDLTLSKDIFSPKPFAQSPRPLANDHGEAGPSVLFHYLQPALRRDHYSKEEPQEDHLVFPPGVGLLLQDWDAGIDPEKYIFSDPSSFDAESNLLQSKIQPVQSRETPPLHSTLPQSQMPPSIAILPVAQQTVIPPRVFAVESQSQMTELAEVEHHNLMMNTQFVDAMCIFQSNLDRVIRNCRKNGVVTFWLKSSFTYSIIQYLIKLSISTSRNKAVVTALSASCISTFAGYPLDSLKSRLQTTKTPISVPRLALTVYREEGISGFYRGLAIPLLTISFVRAASFTIYNSTKDYFKKREWLARDSIVDVSIIGGISGAMSGALISVGSTPFELVKVRRQLEFSIASSKGIHLAKAPGTLEAVRDIFRTSGIRGLYTGFRLHLTRDTTGTMLYFLEYDGMRYLLGRQRSGEQGPMPSWIPIPVSLAPFVCGSFAGVTSWALIYPLDVVKTKVQQRALAGERYRSPSETFHRLIRGPDPNNPKPFLAGVARIYRGLGVSAVRSITTHGLLWTFFDFVANYIDSLPNISDE